MVLTGGSTGTLTYPGERPTLGDLCQFLSGLPVRHSNNPSDAIRVVRGSDLLQPVLNCDLLEPLIAGPWPEAHRLRAGDILIPRITRRPCARLVGPELEGSFAASSVIVVRPLPRGPSPQSLARYLSSSRFFDLISPMMSRLGDAFRFDLSTFQNLVFDSSFESDLPTSKVVVLMDNLARNLIRAIADNSSELRRIEWRILELVLATAFEGLGFEVELTPSSKDGGKDIVLQCIERGSRKKYAIEIKHWLKGKRVGSSQLRKFLDVVVTEDHDRGLILSTSGFTTEAGQHLEYLEHTRLQVGGPAKMVDLCKMYVRGASGLWIADQTPSARLFEKTLEPGRSKEVVGLDRLCHNGRCLDGMS
jgi:HJR/Mrr/RecB family endonuclease